MQQDGSQLGEIKKLVESGSIQTVMDRTFSFLDAIDALLYQKAGRAKGKIVIDMAK